MDRASSSDSSSDSPPRAMGPEDDIPLDPSDMFIGPIPDSAKSVMANLKRHYPGRPLVFSDGAREAKTRRKDPRGGLSGPPSIWDQGSLGQANRQRDELVDQALVEQLRNQFGDPFDDSVLKKAAGTDST
ncbi:hypothetical protein BV20DRAFT_981867 [Pilatotrama ljubarskyi]|nr:hypothetical protein BV20DRAFT_981867 [Pilatotrama ljubarskyi]